MKKSLLSLLCALCVFFFLLTAAIGLPIYIRPFYYAHIEAFDLARVSGYSEAEIREAYDEVLDYLTLPGKEFSTGVLPHSAEGKAHFEDCKVWSLVTEYRRRYPVHLQSMLQEISTSLQRLVSTML